MSHSDVVEDAERMQDERLGQRLRLTMGPEAAERILLMAEGRATHLLVHYPDQPWRMEVAEIGALADHDEYGWRPDAVPLLVLHGDRLGTVSWHLRLRDSEEDLDWREVTPFTSLAEAEQGRRESIHQASAALAVTFERTNYRFAVVSCVEAAIEHGARVHPDTRVAYDRFKRTSDAQRREGLVASIARDQAALAELEQKEQKPGDYA